MQQGKYVEEECEDVLYKETRLIINRCVNMIHAHHGRCLLSEHKMARSNLRDYIFRGPGPTVIDSVGGVAREWSGPSTGIPSRLVDVD